MNEGPFSRVEDYTNAFLGAFYLSLVTGLVVVWGIWGYAVALLICAALHGAIHHFGRKRAEAAAAWEARVAAAIARHHSRRDDRDV
ncbi:hypothetical protein [Jannaschia pohangensis]|uniref:Uncharacterized protein n=1 Tax=Jannaschia pohangensis TaxID=390807 RepID=A0A1I3JMI1_9RHOB|nr:hypothetical protein [Jannaschia pohangensis]SFI61453.1 hypothetical protein SAMN04488095_1369 [Jannaschia pohangensis]